MPSKKKKYNARFPAGRIKKIMQSDEEVGKVAQAVPIIISRAPRTLELFVESLLNKTLRITSARNAKTLSPSHMRQCIMAENQFDFLRELVKNVPDINVAEEQQQQGLVASTSATRSAASSDDDVEYVPTDLSVSSHNRTATSMSNVSSAAATQPYHSNGQLARNVAGDNIHPSSYHTTLDLSSSASQAPVATPALRPASATFVANYYTEIDNSSSSASTTGSPSAKSSPASSQGTHPQQMPSTNYYNSNQTSGNAAGSLPLPSPSAAVVTAHQPPIISFDFTRGLANTTIRYAAEPTATTASSSTTSQTSVVAAAGRQQQPPEVPTVNVAIDQLTMKPLVKIDYSHLNFNNPPTVAITAAAAATTTASPVMAPTLDQIMKPRRGRPPKIRPPPLVQPLFSKSSISMAATTAPASAPVLSVYATPSTPTVSRLSRTISTTSSPDDSGAAGGMASKYQKLGKKSRRASSGTTTATADQHMLSSSTGQKCDSMSGTLGGSFTAQTSSLLSNAAVLAPLPSVLGSSSCLDMDEDYDNI